ncbi:YciI family protein [Micromonospora sp. PSH03]|uniref:YciI family protein n=1 Tax=Micromonospora salmantinae TaxID=2911211 RepID=UPI001EE9373E|nr:YciI family protein [Micromonospora salmantinae]MCG5455491.1 YciI family protein [Micromonospora salmantinae]
MTLYLLSIHQPQGELPPEPEFLAGVMRQLGELRDELASTGSWVFGQGLHGPETATVLRPRDGEVLTTDGPFVEGKEYLGGITIIDAPDLDAALLWGRRYALATTLPIEVRPFQGGAGD